MIQVSDEQRCKDNTKIHQYTMKGIRLKDGNTDVQLALLSAILYFQHCNFSEKKTVAMSAQMDISILAHHESILHIWTHMFKMPSVS